MFKKFTSLLLIFAMLVTSSPVLAAGNTPAKPTVEEILNEYQQKAFEAESAETTDNTTTYSNRSSSRTLEQETVDALNSAGYEAYNVTPSNYHTLEAKINTDFASMGLDPGGSYIIAISGEDNGILNSQNTSRGFLPEQDIFDDGGSPYFEYTYENTTYSMRYVTVTSADRSTLKRQIAFGVDRAQNTSRWGDIIDTVLSFYIDGKAKVPISTIASLLVSIFGNNLPTAQSYDGFVVTGATTWTLQFIEVYDTYDNIWVPSQCSEYAITTWSPTHWVYYEPIKDHKPYTGETITFRTNSEDYSNTAYRKQAAAEYYCIGSRMLDFTGDITIRLEGLDGEYFYITNNGYAYVQTHWLYYDYDF